MAAPVEVLRDRYGVPAVMARDEADLFRAQGWLHAADRLLQMELLRRAGSGRLAELVGAAGLPADRLVRTLGFHLHAPADLELLSASTRAALESYAEGVNAWIAHARRRRRLPVEFRLLGATPEPWLPEHCLFPTRLMALSLCGNWQGELARAEIAHQFGSEVLQALDEDAHARPFPAQVGTDVLGELVTAARDLGSGLGLGYGTGSNNWVIGPRRTASGGALLANDPHLDLTLPSVWYEQLLRCPTYEARGFTIPGAPGIVLGHNGTVAWGFTNSCVDVQDLYVEEVDAVGGRYLDVDGEWHALDVRREPIRVRRGHDVVLEVRSTRRGPLITDAIEHGVEGAPLSIRWDSIMPGRICDALFGMARAGSWQEFRKATALWPAPAQNVVYADTSGNIGFVHAGDVPVRADHDGTMPRAGTDAGAEWIGVLDDAEQPHAFNPANDRIVTANDRIVADDFPHFISVEWMNGYRGRRIRELIDAREGHDVDAQRQIQCDLHSLPGEQLVPAVLALGAVPATEGGRQVLAALARWRYQLAAGDDRAIAWRLVLRAMQEETFGFLGELLPTFLGFSRTGVNGFWGLFGRSTPRIVHDVSADDTTLLELGQRVAAEHGTHGGWQPSATWCQLVERALDRAGRAWVGEGHGGEHHPRMALPGTRGGRATAAAARARGGRALRMRYHRVRLQHPLGMLPGLGAVANHGPFPVGGDSDTVWAAGAFNNPLNDNAMVGPSHRNVVDLADLDRSQAVLCGGQSGHPMSPHYVDQVRLWRDGQLRPAPWSQHVLERDAVYRQTLG